MPKTNNPCHKNAMKEKERKDRLGEVVFHTLLTGTQTKNQDIQKKLWKPEGKFLAISN